MLELQLIHVSKKGSSVASFENWPQESFTATHAEVQTDFRLYTWRSACFYLMHTHMQSLAFHRPTISSHDGFTKVDTGTKLILQGPD